MGQRDLGGGRECEEGKGGVGWLGEYEKESAGGGGESVSPAARAKSGGLDAVGRGGVGEGESGEQASVFEYRIFHVSLVSCDGAGIV